MEQTQSITISGDLGSGKTTISQLLAERLGIRRIGAGDIYRRMAAERGMTAMQLNLHSFLDDAVDSYIDQLQNGLAQSGEQVVLDSRLGWHFFSSAFKVYLSADPNIAAKRVLSRASTATESYSSLEEARERLHERSESERRRFLEKYHADKSRLRNYNLICDTTDLAPEDVVELILSVIQGVLGKEVLEQTQPLLVLNPRRIYPSESIASLRGLEESDYVEVIGRLGPANLDPLGVGCSAGYFYTVDGHWRLSAAIQKHFDFALGYLIAERKEIVTSDISADEYFHSETTLSMIYDWEAAHDVHLEIPPHLRARLCG
jgi:predicted cytidylate kinase